MIQAEMNRAIREAVRFELIRQDRTQTEVAEKIGVSRQYLSKLLRGHADGGIETWQKLFDELALELMVKPRAEGLN